MSEPSEFQRKLHRIRLLLGEGQQEIALTELDAIQTNDPQEQQEINYTRAEYYTQIEQWDKAVQYLEPLYSSRANEENWNAADHTERERRAYYLLWLGNAAANVSRYQ